MKKDILLSSNNRNRLRMLDSKKRMGNKNIPGVDFDQGWANDATQVQFIATANITTVKFLQLFTVRIN